jgi:glycosyltransferase involved in cell wall biosynthesis
MKLALISTSQVPSSAANSIQVMKVGQALRQLGHDLLLLVPQGGAQPAPNLAEWYGLKEDFPIEWLTAAARLKRYDFCWRAVRRAAAWGAQAVYAWPLQAALLASWHGLPTLFELHEPPTGRIGPWLFRAYLRAQTPKRVLPISKALLDRMGLNAAQCVISHDAVDLERYTEIPSPEAARHSLGLIERPTVGYTGHLYPGRGMTLLLTLAERFPGVQFLWVGGRPRDVADWRARLAAQGLTNITLTGFVDNARLPLYQAAAEVLVMPYERSVSGSSGGNTADFCSPMKMFEYMACRRAILSSELPVLREVLSEQSAVFCPPDDTEAWAAALARLLADPHRRAALAAQAWQDVQPYTWVERAQRALEGFTV